MYFRATNAICYDCVQNFIVIGGVHFNQSTGYFGCISNSIEISLVGKALSIISKFWLSCVSKFCLKAYPFYLIYLENITTWWRHQMETFSALLVLCAGNSPVTGEFPSQRPVTRSFDLFFALRLNTRLSKQWWCWWFETPPCLLWRHCKVQLLFHDFRRNCVVPL